MIEETITEQRKGLIQEIIDTLDFYVLLVDETHHIVLANKTTSAILGLENSQIVGKYCPKLIHAVEGTFPGCPLEAAVKSGNTETAELYDPKHGRWMDSRIYPAVFRTQTGRRVYLHMVFDITDKKTSQEQLQKTLAKLRTALGGIIAVIQEVIEKRDPSTAGHQRRMADLARSIAKDMGLSEDQVDVIRLAAIIHDLGKISIPSEILAKPGKLTDSEFDFIKLHSKSGYDILSAVELPWPIADIILQHHERLDGSGYPQGLKGEDILVEARILAVADVVEAMASHRPYRAALGIDKALEEISSKKGALYDPGAVDACLNLFRQKGYRLKD